MAARSPAEAAGLMRGDIILQSDGSAATAAALSQALFARKPGDQLRLRIARAGAEIEIDATLAGNLAKTYELSPAPRATPAQSAILSDWLRAAQ